MTYTIEDMPAYVPWQLLIRARYVHEIDALIASTVIENIGRVAGSQVTRTLVEAAHAAGHAEPQAATPEQRVAALEAIDDWERCGTRYPHWWPPHHHLGFDDLSDPVVVVLQARAFDLVRAVGSERLQQTLGSALSAGAKRQAVHA
ncbi:MAG: hypothetical protein ACJ72E_02975 [Marmoricola sp.]